MENPDILEKANNEALAAEPQLRAPQSPDALEERQSVALTEQTRPQVEGALSAKPKKREISPEQAERLLDDLKSHFFSANWGYQRTSNEWAEIENALRANPEALFSLQGLKDTGGEAVYGTGNKYFLRFEDEDSANRKMNYNDAVALAKELGVDMVGDKVVSNRGSKRVYIKIDREAWRLGMEKVIAEESHGRPNSKRPEVDAKSNKFRCTVRGWRAAFSVKIG